jgi:hypothetical protein
MRGSLFSFSSNFHPNKFEFLLVSYRYFLEQRFAIESNDYLLVFNRHSKLLASLSLFKHHAHLTLQDEVVKG